MGRVETQSAKIKIIKFKNLWNNYPSDENKHIDKKINKIAKGLENHCALNLSQALLSSGVSLKSYKSDKCWSCPSGTNNTHAIRATELAMWLKTRPFKGCHEPIKCKGKDFKTKLKNKKGIIYFEDYWQRPNEIGTNKRTGDHIDLWDDERLAGSNSFESFIRIGLGISWDGTFSDYTLSNKVLFWEMK